MTLSLECVYSVIRYFITSRRCTYENRLSPSLGTKVGGGVAQATDFQLVLSDKVNLHS